MEVRIDATPTGFGTKVLIDGVEIERVSAINFQAIAGELSKVTLELRPQKVIIQGNINPENISMSEVKNG